ncbi:MAG: UbiA-like polyprenyltransferase [Acidobacteriota bacterium]
MAAPGSLAGRLAVTLEMIRFQHTVFALPFALTGMVLAADGLPPPGTVAWVLVAMVGARSAAMAFNRIADRHLDARNPRTAGRALPAGRLGLGFAWTFTAASAALFLLAAAMLNPLCFRLSPIALLVILGYSYTKRFTATSHLVLGLALGIAPMGGWLAVTGSFLDAASGRPAWAPWFLTGAVLAWTAGFDITYSLQDVEFDRSAGLRSIPVRLGPAGALAISRALHGLMVALLALLVPVAGLGPIFIAGLLVIAALLIYEHALVRPGDLRRLDTAFFRVNAIVSILVLILVTADRLL